jgi:hypothetical protein
MQPAEVYKDQVGRLLTSWQSFGASKDAGRILNTSSFELANQRLTFDQTLLSLAKEK